MSTAAQAPRTPTVVRGGEPEIAEGGRYLLDRQRLLGPLLLLPAVVYILALVGIPFVVAILYSFSDVTVGDQSIDWVGLKNFRDVIRNHTFQIALRNTFVFAIVSQVIVIILANILAQVLAADFHGKRVVRYLILLPWTTPIALSAIGWLWLLDNIYSPVDAVLRELHLLGPGTLWGPTRNMHWLAKPDLAQLSVLTVHVWRTLPLTTVILLAGLTSIPQDINDAAEIDGASYWRKLFYIRLPLLVPIAAVAVLYGIVFTFTDMTVVYILTGGGPVDRTQVLASWAFYKGIGGSNLSQGAAIALFLFPVLVGVAALMLRLARRTETT
ncbi:MAG: multiple sugar transport system permease protein [Thermomicrobiales bacterium]|nr:multiple sugar transport system permease protein [Thermomicrobiales bacterium]MEA2527302.1 multiple sugar transport system permease protein [Thermomicrobiales bacterium]MEA2597315.1 multiple sugar transport system permease protein [Thermomicrobiales bacterium]